MKVPDKCLDAIQMVVHQLNLYQSTVKALGTLPKSRTVDQELRLYISLSAYLAAILSAFRGELTADTNIVTTKWRSMHLDLHIALALHESSFTLEQQAVALKKMKWSWSHFKEKKPYKKVQDTTAAGLHAHFSLNGDNMCAGPFKHTRSPADLTAEMVQMLQSATEAKEEVKVKQEKGLKSVSFGGNDKQFEVEIMPAPPQNATGSKLRKSSNGKMVKATAEPVTNLHDSSDKMVINVDEEEDNAPLIAPGVKSKCLGKAVDRKSTMQVAGSRQPRPASMVSDEEESHTEQVASNFEGKKDTKKTAKNRKTNPKATRNIKKGKRRSESPAVKSKECEQNRMAGSPSDVESNSGVTLPAKCAGRKGKGHPLIESEDEELEDVEDTGTPGKEEQMLRIENESVGSVQAEECPYDLEMSQDSADELDDIILPPGLENWDTWNKVAFERGNSQIFLKLGAWMLLRFRQLAMIPVDGDVNGLIIPESPQGMSFENQDDFYKALAMERLYSVIAHIDTRPRFMRHILHRLGRSVASADDADSQSQRSAVGSPPAVTLSMMSDMIVPWLLLTNGIHDNLGSDVVDEHGTVTDALQEMAIDSIDNQLDLQPDRSDRTEGKQKRTTSHASPPKQDGGCGPSKCPKDGMELPAFLTTPIPIEITPTVASIPEVSDIPIDEDPDVTGEDDDGSSLVDGEHVEIVAEADHGNEVENTAAPA
ncbi:uncharacterized protein F5147DRAFT_773822 [Suillus discolor]|uniref:Uncharacterized protein n=1 Tax=Suillus discolor TaxID=1912936 RepID=A0A9P7F848_9AGAM|nr:uncharacterized protein F5147DRAFT_773822 [Suillus discolor]KAG2108240.1 hypothetical protein F5147DRAFT_773822 [Suillus discolor]